MKCGICSVKYCSHRRTDGDCYYKIEGLHYFGHAGVGMKEAEYKKLRDAATDLVDAVEGYVEPKPGQDFVHRSEILEKKNQLKALLK